MRQFPRIDLLQIALLPLLLALGGCDKIIPKRPDLTIPPKEEVAKFYEQYQNVTAVTMSGNVAMLRVEQPQEQLEHGGELWARVGPYVYLLSSATYELFKAYPGIAAVRVITYDGEEQEVARAMLVRDTMGDYQWQRTADLLSKALREGATTPSRILDLLRWGEQFADYKYNPVYVGR